MPSLPHPRPPTADINRADAAFLAGLAGRVASDPAARASFAFQTRMIAAQGQPPAALAAMAERQARMLLDHARRHVPHYRSTLAGLAAPPRPGSAAWQALPIVERAALQADKAAFRAAVLPPGQTVLGPLRSSGSVGVAVEIVSTNVFDTWQKALALRAAIWARRDFSGSLGVIRKFSNKATRPPDGAVDGHWGGYAGFPFVTGKRLSLEAVGVSTDQHFDWLQRKRPDYLMTYPSILRALVERSAPSDWRPRGITTLGEQVEDDLRALVRETWAVGIDDVYSAEEAGVIAIQCPSHGAYHVASETVFVEVVGDDGRACAAGEEGRVVVTGLANFATPLIRYAIGDRAVAGERCACGRPFPTLDRILGRERNLMVTDRGDFWPSFGTRRFREIAPIGALQFRQPSRQRLVMQFTAPRPLTDAEQQAVKAAIRRALPVPLEVALERVATLERGPGGKFETFVRTFDV